MTACIEIYGLKSVENNKNMNTLENNKLIAEFLLYPSYCFRGQTIFVTPNNEHVTELEFHNSWDWLMTVVEKIEETNRFNDKEYYPYMVTIWSNGCKITDGNNGLEISGGFSQRKQGGKFSATYNACIEFIKWYNEQPI